MERRDFLKLLAVTAATATVNAYPQISKTLNAPWLYFDPENIDGAGRFPDLKDYRVISPDHRLPADLNGIYSNSPKLYLSDESTQNRYLKKINMLGAKRVRLFIADEVEPQLGQYNDNVLKRVAEFANKVDGVEIDLADFFTIGNCLTDNPVYGHDIPSSPYNPTKDRSGYDRVYTDPKMVAAFQNRIDHIINKLLNDYHIGNIKTWSFNEPAPPGDAAGPEILTNWYKKMVDAIRQIDPKTPVFSGAAVPWHINEKVIPGLTANTFHLYPFNSVNFQKLNDYLHSPQSVLPLVCQEAGFPEQIFGQTIPDGLYNYLYTNFLQKLISYTTVFDHKNKLITPGVLSIGVWKIDTYSDGYNVGPDSYPMKLLQWWCKNVILKL